jgi:hypothetical protein
MLSQGLVKLGMLVVPDLYDATLRRAGRRKLDRPDGDIDNFLSFLEMQDG